MKYAARQSTFSQIVWSCFWEVNGFEVCIAVTQAIDGDNDSIRSLQVLESWIQLGSLSKLVLNPHLLISMTYVHYLLHGFIIHNFSDSHGEFEGIYKTETSS